jgi:hypothetical protein
MVLRDDFGSEHVSFLRGILVVIWSSDREDSEDFRLNRA